jgi:hypothetical protein
MCRWNTAADIAELMVETLVSVTPDQQVSYCQNCGCYFGAGPDGVVDVLYVHRYEAVHANAHACQCHAFGGAWSGIKKVDS